MSKPLHIHTSEQTSSFLETEQGPLPIQGFHALAGVRLTQTIFPADTRVSEAELRRWARRMAWFWHALAFGGMLTHGGWHVSYELRGQTRHAEGGGGASLWVKSAASNVETAVQMARERAEIVAALLPPELGPQIIEGEAQWQALWGADEPAWVGEIRPGIAAAPRDDAEADRSQAAGWDFQTYRWAPPPEAMREVWQLLDRVSGAGWFGIGICPTQLFEGEAAACPPWERTLAGHCFRLRLSVGGDANTAPLLSQALAGAVALPSANGSWPAECRRADLLVPQTPDDWQAAAFNAQWADFQPWAEAPLPVALRRLRYLFSVAEIGVLAGGW